jgi:hypothetical protein
MCPRINKTNQKRCSRKGKSKYGGYCWQHYIKINKWNQLLFQCLILFGTINYYANKKIAKMNEEQIYELFVKIDNLTNNLTI